MKGLLGRLCGSKNSELTVPDSPLRGAGRRQVGDVGVGDLETSHVRFQDSDLGRTLFENDTTLFNQLKIKKHMKRHI